MISKHVAQFCPAGLDFTLCISSPNICIRHLILNAELVGSPQNTGGIPLVQDLHRTNTEQCHALNRAGEGTSRVENCAFLCVSKQPLNNTGHRISTKMYRNSLFPAGFLP
jgi:hypothetical protein